MRSILGRFLEHSRIFWFLNNGDPQVFIGSADMMHRNLDRRVEALVRVADPGHVAQLTELLDVGLADDVSRWELVGDGRWVRVARDGDGNRLVDFQHHLTEWHAKRRRKARRR